MIPIVQPTFRRERWKQWS